MVPAIYKSFRIPYGKYIIPQLEHAIKNKIRENGDDSDNINISLVNGKIMVTVHCGYAVVFEHYESVGYFLGFQRQRIYDRAFGRKLPEPIVNINSNSGGILRSFVPSCKVFGALMRTNPSYVKYVPLKTQSFRLWITDESNELIKLWPEVFYVFHIREKLYP